MQNRTSEFYNSEYWKEIRHKIIERDNHKCIICSETYDLQVHHKEYSFKEYEEHLNDDKLITLCSSCHNAFHSSKKNSSIRKNTICQTVNGSERVGYLGHSIIANIELTACEKVLLMYYSSFVNAKNGDSTHLFRDKEVAKEMQTSVANIRRLKAGLSKKGYLLTIKQGYTQNYYYLIGKDAIAEYENKKISKC